MSDINQARHMKRVHEREASTARYRQKFPSKARFSQYKSYTKNFILHADSKDLKKAEAWARKRHQALDA